MPRKPRVISSTGIYHIILRSVNQHIIFEDPSDYQKFLFILSDCKTKFDIDIFAYCLMDNHIHLLLQAPNNNLSSFFQSLGSRFVRWYNNKYIRSGHLFQERYHSIIIQDEKDYLATISYIHYNPVKASACRFCSEYRWSSYNAFYGEKNDIIDTSYSFVVAGSKTNLQQYFAHYESTFDANTTEFEIPLAKRFLTDEQALVVFQSITQLTTTSDVSKITKVERNQYIRLLSQNNLTIQQVARLMDVSEITVKRLKKDS